MVNNRYHGSGTEFFEHGGYRKGLWQDGKFISGVSKSAEEVIQEQQAELRQKDARIAELTKDPEAEFKRKSEETAELLKTFLA